MNQHDADQVLAEWNATRDRSVTPELQAVETALFLEDTFGIAVADESIDQEALGNIEGMRAVLSRRQQES